MIIVRYAYRATTNCNPCVPAGDGSYVVCTYVVPKIESTPKEELLDSLNFHGGTLTPAACC